jgi:hypothetical protein
MTRLYIPIVGTAFLAGIVSLYVLTQTPAAVDTEIPVLAGLSVMIGFAVWCCADSAERKKKPSKKWQKVFHVWTRRVPGWAERRKD